MDKKYYDYLICNGDANSQLKHGGLPFNLFKAANKNGLIVRAVSLNYRKLKYFKLIWNLFQYIKYGKAGGFQWSEFYAKKMINQIDISHENHINILSIFLFYHLILGQINGKLISI